MRSVKAVVLLVLVLSAKSLVNKVPQVVSSTRLSVIQSCTDLEFVLPAGGLTCSVGVEVVLLSLCNVDFCDGGVGAVAHA